MFPSKMAFTINVPVSTTSLKRALEDNGQALTNESLFMAKYELKYLLENEMPELLKVVAERLNQRTGK